MTLRESLGGDVQRIHDSVDALLNSDDGLLVLFDGRRMVSYTQGFGAITVPTRAAERRA